MLKREKLLDLLKTRFDYYAATAVYNELVSTFELRDVDKLDDAAVQKICAFLGEKLPGTQGLIERLSAFVAAPAAEAPAAEAPAAEAPAEAPAEAAPAEAPAEAAPVEEAPADDGKKKKKK
jgi:small subunit ribosomal protein S2